MDFNGKISEGPAVQDIGLLITKVRVQVIKGRNVNDGIACAEFGF